MVICKTGSIKNKMTMNMILICMGCKYIFIFPFQNRISNFSADFVCKIGIGKLIGVKRIIICQARLSPLSITLFFPISAVIANSRSAVSGEHPKEETSSCSSVLSGFVIYATAFFTVTLIGKILIYAIFLLPYLSVHQYPVV